MDKCFKQLAKELVKIKGEKEMQEFLYGLFTPQEIESIPRRLEIIKLLKKGMPQHEIAQKLGVGVATVTRGSKELKMNKFENV
ncbi:transcriptional regulator [Candidatus Parcubacteria bacterium]|nr:MAG: transcriptional regulator [Candidatus Parcubacteria bacterium]